MKVFLTFAFRRKMSLKSLQKKAWLVMSCISSCALMSTDPRNLEAKISTADDSSFSEQSIDEKLSNMTLEEKVGQLFMVPACPKRGPDHKEDLFSLIVKKHIGSCIMKTASPEEQIAFIQQLQEKAKFPLLIGIDAEWGLGMRMEQTISYPRNLTLGAIQDESLLYLLGKQIGKQVKAVGAQINFAPVVDVNCNPNNPIIHMRSFGENSHNVARKAQAVFLGMQEENISATAKHLPGHGDTEIDSHLSLPIINHSKERLEKIELYPFQQMIDHGIDCIMTAHIAVPALTGDPTLPATLSPKVLKTLLREKMHFSGLIISDALNMKALSDRFSIEEIAYLAHKAGNDILLYGDHIDPNVDDILRNQVPKAIDRIKKAYQDGDLNIHELDIVVKRILQAKERFFQQNQNFANMMREVKITILSQAAYNLKKLLFQKAITCVKNEGNLLPLAHGEKMVYLQIGKPKISYLPLGNFLDKSFFLSPNIPLEDREKILSLVEEKSIVIVSLFELNPREKKFGLNDETTQFIEDLSQRSKVVLCLFGTPYALSFFPSPSAVLIGYEEEEDAQKAVWDVLLGKISPVGKLPVTASSLYPLEASVTW
jgi:beta-N-acetylhexosaminidase